MSDTPLLHEEKADLVDLYKRTMGSGNYGSPKDQESRDEEDARLTLRSAIRVLERRAEKAEARVKELEDFAKEVRDIGKVADVDEDGHVYMEGLADKAESILGKGGNE